jgi:hypothetical protein
MDVIHVLVVNRKLTNAVDPAALVVGRQLGRDDTDIAALAQAFIIAHYTTADIGDLTNLAVASTATQVNVTATARVGTAFLSILSTPFIDITVSSKVQHPRPLGRRRKLHIGHQWPQPLGFLGLRLCRIRMAWSDRWLATTASVGCEDSGHLQQHQGRQLIESDHHIFVYTIVFLVADGAARTMLPNCVTPRDCLGNQCYFESPTVVALQGVFANIALGLNQLRLAH